MPCIFSSHSSVWVEINPAFRLITGFSPKHHQYWFDQCDFQYFLNVPVTLLITGTHLNTQLVRRQLWLIFSDRLFFVSIMTGLFWSNSGSIGFCRKSQNFCSLIFLLCAFLLVAYFVMVRDTKWPKRALLLRTLVIWFTGIVIWVLILSSPKSALSKAFCTLYSSMSLSILRLYKRFVSFEVIL